MAVKGWNILKWLEIDGMAGIGWKCFKIAGNGWNWLERLAMAGKVENDWRWLEMAWKCLK